MHVAAEKSTQLVALASLFSANPTLPVLVEVRFLGLFAPFSLTAESGLIENLESGALLLAWKHH